jgi:hypothetical protein
MCRPTQRYSGKIGLVDTLYHYWIGFVTNMWSKSSWRYLASRPRLQYIKAKVKNQVDHRYCCASDCLEHLISQYGSHVVRTDPTITSRKQPINTIIILYIVPTNSKHVFEPPTQWAWLACIGVGGVLVGRWNTLFKKSRKQLVDFNNLFSCILVHSDAR